MPTNVVMPQMGESIAEGTVVRWIKKIGDAVERDEPLFEISTDKVDAEIPSPAAGVLTEIKVKEGETVPVDSVVAVIGAAGDRSAEPPAGASPVPQATHEGEAPAGRADPAASGQEEPASAPVETGEAGAIPSREELRRKKSSPLVRRIAAEHRIDLSSIRGSGINGRVTKQDILAFIEKGGAEAPGAGAADEARPPVAPAGRTGERVEIVPMPVMRRKIAEHMVLSRRTSAHVHSVFDIDFTQVERVRQAKKAEYERAGVRLTYLPFIARAIVESLRRHPVVNASLDADNIVYKKDINLGIAVALENGLIVPVLKNADERNVLGLARGIADLAERARAKQLKPEEVQGGTFTITNPGAFGASFGLPIINQPQVAILGVGAVEKRPVVIDDAIGIRLRAYLTLGYDHRLIDGAVADQFMSDVKRALESVEPASL